MDGHGANNPAASSHQGMPVDSIPGIADLWQHGRGHAGVCIAVLDGPVDTAHPCFAGADLIAPASVAAAGADAAAGGHAARHGTHIASLVFGQHGRAQHGKHEIDAVRGVAPGCRGLLLPIFATSGGAGAARDGRTCSQLDVARAIERACDQGAHIINISAGQWSASGEAHPVLVRAIERALAAGVVIVAAAGNDGCACVHVPGAVAGVLPVGAMDEHGEPLAESNWGPAYHGRGLLAMGQSLRGAAPGGGTLAQTGTSVATAVVSGVLGLLASVLVERGVPAGRACERARAALVRTAVDCRARPTTDCQRLLAGRVDPGAALQYLLNPSNQAGELMSEQHAIITPDHAHASAATPASLDAVMPSACGCEAKTAASQPAAGASAGAAVQRPTLGYALGRIGYDFGTSVRRESLMQHMDGAPDDPARLLAYLQDHPWDAEAVIWTLNLDETPIYAIRPVGAYAAAGFERVRAFLAAQIRDGVEQVSIPGVVTGSAVLMNGQELPLLMPALRGMYSWSTAALVESVCGAAADTGSATDDPAYAARAERVGNFLRRMYYELRNLGVAPRDRAMNYAATNAFQVGSIFSATIREDMELSSIAVERSPICRPESDCWDVKLSFFNPGKRLEQSQKVYRFTVDVSDVMPVMVGEVRSWFTY